MKTAVVAIGIFVLILTARAAPQAQEAQGHIFSPVTLEESWKAVAGELRLRGVREELFPRAADLILSAAVPARERRSLRVSSVCRNDDAGSVRFRLECGEPGACLPFLVYWRGGGSRAEAPSCRLQSSNRRAIKKEHAEPSVRVGQTANAVMTAAGLRMSAAVICLERGASGEIVRVRAKEGRIFRARVSGPGLVEALTE
ncbi:MAG TPA: flagella basal body P-ring formation protein FlgA [Terriglobales bacterium]|nr:flagella basal body P-ring formation protein FlgA [Terriglobales bacterium]